MDNFTVASCVITCIVIFTILSIIIKLGQWRRLYKQASKFPGPPALPLVGNTQLFAGSTEAFLNTLIQFGKSYPAPYRLWFGTYLTFVVNIPEQFRVILQSPKAIDKIVFYDFIQPWVGTGLVTAPGAKWRVHRKSIEPTFGSTILRSFIGTFAARSMIMAKEMERHLDGPEFDIYKYTSQCTLHIICETTMGVNLAAQSNDNSRYAEALENIVCKLCKRIVSPWLHPNFIFHRTQLGKAQQEDINFMHGFTDNIIQKKKKEFRERSLRPVSQSADCEENNSSWIPRRKILLDHLIEESRDSKIWSDEAIREEVDTMIAAGSDSTAAISTYVMLMLASHPKIQERVHQELCEIYEHDDGEKLRVTPKDLTRMTYTERVIKETMRLFPITPILGRSLTGDLDIGEHTFPAGSSFVLSIIELHRNADIWPDPLKFDPDRFLPEEVAKRDSYAYLPFSGGLRNCIGSKYAMMSMKTLLATIILRYVLKKDNIIPVKDLRLKWEFALRPVDPITIRIERRIRKVASI